MLHRMEWYSISKACHVITLHSVVRYGTVLYGPVQSGTAWYGLALCSTVQHDAAKVIDSDGVSDSNPVAMA